MNITSANSKLTISSSAISLAATVLEGFSADASFAFSDVEVTVGQVGIDGRYSAGWVPSLKTLTVTFSPDSPSIAVMDMIITMQDTMRDPVFVNMTLTIPSVGKSFTMGPGTMVTGRIAPDGARVLAPMMYTFSFSDMKPAIL
jgi:hypothetical protein